MTEKRIWRTIDGELFQFSTTARRELPPCDHRSAFWEAAAVIEPALNIDQVGHTLAEVGWDDPVDDESLPQALDSLVKWDLLEATQDHGAKYNTPQEFERKNLQWSLTARGEAAIASISTRWTVSITPSGCNQPFSTRSATVSPNSLG